MTSPHPSLPALQSRARLLGLLGLQGPVAQSGERRPRMAEVRGSSPLGSTLFSANLQAKGEEPTVLPEHIRDYCTATQLPHRSALLTLAAVAEDVTKRKREKTE
jgi:hypothetical protein